jgi:hypothetical protein
VITGSHPPKGAVLMTMPCPIYFSSAKWVGEKDEINCADKIDNRRRRTGQAKRPAPQTRENSLGR